MDGIPKYPWLASQWPRFSRPIGELHHALVLAGPSGIGKREFAVHLIQRLLCQEEGEYACGQCQDCHLFASGSHPDVHVLMTEQEKETGRIELFSAYSERYPERPGREQRAGPSKTISIEKVRLLIEHFYQSSYSATGKVALLLPADRMNDNASNALLKILEEPPPGNHFLLVTDHPGSLLPTIRSRCLVEMLTGPTLEESREWLKEQVRGEDPLLFNNVRTGMGPLDLLADQKNGVLDWQADHLAAMQGILTGQSDPVKLAEDFQKQDPALLLSWLQRLTSQLIQWQFADSDSPLGPAGGDHSRQIRFSAVRLFELYVKIGRYRRIARDQLNLRYALEEIMISLMEAVGTSR